MVIYLLFFSRFHITDVRISLAAKLKQRSLNLTKRFNSDNSVFMYSQEFAKFLHYHRPGIIKVLCIKLTQFFQRVKLVNDIGIYPFRIHIQFFKVLILNIRPKFVRCFGKLKLLLHNLKEILRETLRKESVTKRYPDVITLITIHRLYNPIIVIRFNTTLCCFSGHKNRAVVCVICICLKNVFGEIKIRRGYNRILQIISRCTHTGVIVFYSVIICRNEDYSIFIYKVFKLLLHVSDNNDNLIDTLFSKLPDLPLN